MLTPQITILMLIDFSGNKGKCLPLILGIVCFKMELNRLFVFFTCLKFNLRERFGIDEYRLFLIFFVSL